MAVLLKVRPNTSPKEAIINLITFMYKWLKSIGFEPESFQLWEKAHSEELGGRVLGVYKNLSGIRKFLNFGTIKNCRLNDVMGYFLLYTILPPPGGFEALYSSIPSHSC